MNAHFVDIAAASVVQCAGEEILETVGIQELLATHVDKLDARVWQRSIIV